jgi:hypothetical protein
MLALRMIEAQARDPNGLNTRGKQWETGFAYL